MNWGAADLFENVENWEAAFLMQRDDEPWHDREVKRHVVLLTVAEVWASHQRDVAVHGNG